MNVMHQHSTMGIREWIAGAWRIEKDRQAASPEAAQTRTLMRIVRQNAATHFGQEHRFDRIDTVEAFQSAVPVQTPHTLRPRIEHQRSNGHSLLSAEIPETYWPAAAAGRLVPVTTAETRTRARFAQFLEEELASETRGLDGVVIDLAPLDAGHENQMAPLSFGQAMSKLPDLSDIGDLELRAYVVALIALASSRVTAFHAPDAAAFKLLMNVIERHRSALLRDLIAGRPMDVNRLGAGLADQVTARLATSSTRLRALKAALKGDVAPGAEELWPTLSVVVTDDSRNRQEDRWRLALMLSADTRVLDMGCWLNEAIITLPHEVGGEGGLPAADDVFYEFAQPGSESLKGLHELEENVPYRVHVTTISGLYRYAVPVIAEVTGWSGSWPYLSVRRVSGPENGRKKTLPGLHHASLAAREALDASGPGAPFCRVSPGPRAGHFQIHLSGDTLPPCLVERLRGLFDSRLRTASLHYDRLRADGVLPLVAVCQPGAASGQQRTNKSMQVA